MKKNMYHYNDVSFKYEGMGKIDEGKDILPFTTFLPPPDFDPETQIPRFVDGTWAVGPLNTEQEQIEVDKADILEKLKLSDNNIRQAIDTLFDILVGKGTIIEEEIDPILLTRLRYRKSLRQQYGDLSNGG